MPNKQFRLRKAIRYSIVVFVVCLVAAFLLFLIKPVSNDQSARYSLSFLAAILGILAAGCMQAFFSFTYKDAEDHEKGSVRMIAGFLIGAVFLLVFLCMYCLRKTGAFALYGWLGTLYFFSGDIFHAWRVSLARNMGFDISQRITGQNPVFCPYC